MDYFVNNRYKFLGICIEGIGQGNFDLNPDVYQAFQIPDDLKPYIRRVLAAATDDPIRMEPTIRATGYCYIGCIPRGRWRGLVNGNTLFDSDRDGPVHLSGQIKDSDVRAIFDGPLTQVFAEFTALGQYQLLGIEGSANIERACPPQVLNAERGNALSGVFDADTLDDIVVQFLAQLAAFAETPLDVPEYLPDLVERLENTESVESIGELAAVFGVSERHLRREFTRIVGLGPKEFRSVVRVTSALSWLLSKKDAELAELAAECGFSDQAHLTRAFQKFLGDSPRSISSNIETTLAKFVGQCRRL